jgi:drug/metabolite transporter (DMT)-like permease
MNERKDLAAYLALAAICLIWGTTYLALRIAVMHFPPFLFIAIRQTLSGLLLVLFMMLVMKQSLPSRQDLFRQAIAGFFLISMGNGLVAWAELYIPSGLAAIICSLMPLVVILLNISINKEERPNMAIVVGTLMGFAGIVMIFSENLGIFSSSNYVIAVLLTLTAVFCWAGGSIWVKKKSSPTNLFVNAGLQMFFGGLWLFPVSMVVDDLSAVHWSTQAFYAMLYLIAFGSIIAYACYAYALRSLPMTIVSLYAYVNPIVAVLLGWLILNEPLSAWMWVSICITIAGIYIVNKGYQLRNQWKAGLSANQQTT